MLVIPCCKNYENLCIWNFEWRLNIRWVIESFKLSHLLSYLDLEILGQHIVQTLENEILQHSAKLNSSIFRALNSSNFRTLNSSNFKELNTSNCASSNSSNLKSSRSPNSEHFKSENVYHSFRKVTPPEIQKSVYHANVSIHIRAWYEPLIYLPNAKFFLISLSIEQRLQSITRFLTSHYNKQNLVEENGKNLPQFKYSIHAKSALPIPNYEANLK